MENTKTKWVGVDTHKDTLACYMQDKFKEFKTTTLGFKQALKWAGDDRDINWAIEGAYCFGKPFANFLIKNNCKVYEINPFITKSWRSALSTNGNKNDYGDAKVISIFSKNLKLKEISLKTITLKERITARELLVKQRTKLINSIKMLNYTRGTEINYSKLTSTKAIESLKNSEDIIIRNFGEIIDKLTNSIKEMEKEIDEMLPKEALKLTQITGINKLSAAIIYTETKGKLTSKESFASYCAISPIENSSGKIKRHNTNHRGNRRLNSIFYRMSICQSIYDEKGKLYFEKKLKEGKTKRHARKCLARQLCNSVFKILQEACQV